MKVRIQLIRDNGNVVMDMLGDAAGPVVWNVPNPAEFLVLENGTKMDGFTYTASMCDFVEMTDQDREILCQAMAKVVGE